jgi:uncharacterized BrkB/YihY/UPF0761 family membrane protein
MVKTSSRSSQYSRYYASISSKKKVSYDKLTSILWAISLVLSFVAVLLLAIPYPKGLTYLELLENIRQRRNAFFYTYFIGASLGFCCFLYRYSKGLSFIVRLIVGIVLVVVAPIITTFAIQTAPSRTIVLSE